MAIKSTQWEGELPAPRLQLRWEKPEQRINGYNWLCHYELVIPLDQYDVRAEQYDEEGDLLPEKLKEQTIPMREGASMRGSEGIPCTTMGGDRYYDSPFRDGAHAYWDAKLLGNLPIFVIAPDGVAFKREE
jgi:hypothetical protein